MLYFFFKQQTAYEMRISDWSSDVCSSDLTNPVVGKIGDVDVPPIVGLHIVRFVQSRLYGRASVSRVSGIPVSCDARDDAVGAEAQHRVVQRIGDEQVTRSIERQAFGGSEVRFDSRTPEGGVSLSTGPREIGTAAGREKV